MPMMNSKNMLTIGQLAKRVGLRTSALRYYEEQGLLQPTMRRPNGYRLYDAQNEQTLRFIQRAQRLGFSLADIRRLQESLQNGGLKAAEIIRTAEARYLAIEEEVTQLLVLRHEMGLFLQDMHARQVQHPEDATSDALLAQFVDRVCANPHAQSPSAMLEWLLQQTGCQLTTEEGTRLLAQLRGQHVHIWQEEGGYNILVTNEEPAIGQALRELAELEAHCQLHPHETEAPELMHNDEGYLLVVRGRNAFIFARLFLALSVME